MTKYSVRHFGGLMPRVAPKQLPDTAAQTAHNVDLRAGDLRPLYMPTVVDSLPIGTKTIYKYEYDKYVMTCGNSGTFAAFQAITKGAFIIPVGGQEYTITGLDFSGTSDMDGVAAVIQAGIRASGADSYITVAYATSSTGGNGVFTFTSSFPLAALKDYPGSTGNGWGDGSDGALTVSTDTSLTSTQDGGVVVKQYTDLTVNSGKTLTVSDRCCGLAIYVQGTLTLNGMINMTARGAKGDPLGFGVPSAGLQIRRLTSSGAADLENGSVVTGCGSTFVATEAANSATSDMGTGQTWTILPSGADGGATSGSRHGNPGKDGGVLQSGGGGSGCASNYFATSNTYPPLSANGGAGAAGTCFGGGTGGGGGGVNNGTPVAGSAAVGNGGAGGAGGAYATGYGVSGGGGAGNPGGASATGGSGGGAVTPGVAGAAGTGGFLFICAKNIAWGASGKLYSRGSGGHDNYIGTGDAGNGGWTAGTTYVSYGGGGGGSGGGVILVIHAGLTGTPVYSCGGGSGGYGGGQSDYTVVADGGTGSCVIAQVSP